MKTHYKVKFTGAKAYAVAFGIVAVAAAVAVAFVESKK